MKIARPSFFIAVLALSACGASEQESATTETDPLIEAETEARAELAENGMVYCALNGAPGFRPDCQIERTQGDEGVVLTMRHPDGGFRRLLITGDGRGLVAADGSEPAVVNPISEREIEVTIAFDRYRLPATVR